MLTSLMLVFLAVSDGFGVARYIKPKTSGFFSLIRDNNSAGMK